MICRALKWAGGKLADLLFGEEGDYYVSRTTLEGKRPMSVEELVRSQVSDIEREGITRCALHTDWCDGVVCLELGIRCPNAPGYAGSD